MGGAQNPKRRMIATNHPPFRFIHYYKSRCSNRLIAKRRATRP